MDNTVDLDQCHSRVSTASDRLTPIQHSMRTTYAKNLRRTKTSRLPEKRPSDLALTTAEASATSRGILERIEAVEPVISLSTSSETSMDVALVSGIGEGDDIKPSEILTPAMGFPFAKATNTQKSPAAPPFASLEPDLRNFIDLIQKSPFYLENRLEPTIGSEEGASLLSQSSEAIRSQSGSLSNTKSVYAVFIEEGANKCRICKSSKYALVRALQCVRSHLDHRPFVCPGAKGGCKRCSNFWGHARFFSKDLLRDHITSQTQKYQCVHEGCSATIRRGGMRRHWNSMHKDEPFPVHLYPGYNVPDGSK